MDKTEDEKEINDLLRELNETPDDQTGPGPDAELEAEAPAVDTVEEPEPTEPTEPAEGDAGEVVAGPEAGQAPADQTGDKPDKEQRTVPYDAMYAERAKRQELETKLRDIETQRAQDRGELSTLKEMLQGELARREEAKTAAEAEANQPKKLDPVAVPDWNDDPRGYAEASNRNAEILRHNDRIDYEQQIAAEAERFAKLEETVTTTVDQYQQTTKADQERAQVYGAVSQHERAFATQNADYFDAVAAYKDAKLKDYQAIGYDALTAEKAAQNDLENEAKSFLAQRIDPAQAWYSLAKNRGFGAPAAPAQNGALAPGNGQPTPNGAQQQQPQPQPQRKPGQPSAANMARGMAASDGLAQAASSGGGVAPDPEATLSTILDTKDDEWLAANMDKVDKLMAQIEGR